MKKQIFDKGVNIIIASVNKGFEIPSNILDQIGKTENVKGIDYVITNVFMISSKKAEIRGIKKSNIEVTESKIQEWKESSIKVSQKQFAFQCGSVIGEYKIN